MFCEVILFVLRALKNLDFQPRIALVTRTLSTAFTDLIHFFLLFALVTCGYCIAGMLLFGNQYEGFSTIGSSALTLIIMLIAWNPGDSWVQVAFKNLNGVPMSCCVLNESILLYPVEPCSTSLGIQHLHMDLDSHCILYSGMSHIRINHT
jgi:hypothetical protein